MQKFAPQDVTHAVKFSWGIVAQTTMFLDDLQRCLDGDVLVHMGYAMFLPAPATNLQAWEIGDGQWSLERILWCSEPVH